MELSVADDGQGIPPEVLPRVFDPFFTTKAVGQGTGMGLSVVQGIVRNMGGHAVLTSRPGKGTTLRLLFPPRGQERGSSRKGSPASPALRGPTGRSARLMVVDDEPMLCRALSRTLTSRGYQASGFTDARAALKAFEEDPGGFDALITDETMPELTGSELARAVLALRPGFPIFMCTGNADLVDLPALQRCGVRRLFEKPVAPEQLAAAIDEACAPPVLLGAAGDPAR